MFPRLDRHPVVLSGHRYEAAKFTREAAKTEKELIRTELEENVAKKLLRIGKNTDKLIDDAGEVAGGPAFGPGTPG